VVFRKYIKLIAGLLAIYLLLTIVLPSALQILQPDHYRETLRKESYETGALFYSESPYALEQYYLERKKRATFAKTL